MGTEPEKDELIESEDAGDVGALIIRAADQLAFAGPAARATVLFAVDDQWFRCTLQMTDESEAAS